MNLQQFLLIIRARYKVVFFILLSTVAVALALSVLLPKQYTATASVVVDVKSPDPIAGMMLPVMPGYMATQVDIIKSERVAHKVVKLLRLDENLAIKEQWMEATKGIGTLDTGAPTISGRWSQKVTKFLKLFEIPAITEKGISANQMDSELEVWLIERLQKKLNVKPSLESNVINIDYTATDPGSAAAIANAFAQAYIDTNIELKVEPAKQYARWFGQQGRSLRDTVEKAQAKLSEYQQKHGIVASEERLDNETAKFNELSAQLTVVQGQTSDAQSKQKSGSASDTLPEVVQNLLIQNLKADIAQKEAKLQELAVNLGKNHPQYQRGESEIASLKQKLEAETRHITSGFSTSRNVGKEKETELKAAIEAQKRKVLDLKKERDQLTVLQRDVDASQKAYDAVTQRFNQSSLESQSTQTNVSVLTSASDPIKPSFPKIGLNSLIAVVLGTLLGVVAALVFEIFDRRIRSAEDLAEMLQLPVLGVIQRSKKRSRFAFWRRRTA
jgi:chain length determinant protein EpsF